MINISREENLIPQNLPAYLKDVITNIDGQPSKSESTIGSNELLFKISLNQLLERTEREHIIRALKYTNGNIVKASEILNLPRQTLKYRMDKLNISYKQL
jgi:arginine utilization regulatory protein